MHDHNRAAAVGELASITCGDHSTGNSGAQTLNAVIGGAGADALVIADGDLLGHQAHNLVGHAHGDGDGGDLGLEQTGFECGAGALLAGGTVFVHGFAADVVALGHVLGGLQHVPVDFGLVLDQPGVGHHVGVHFLLHTRNGFHTTGYINIALIGDDALCRGCNGLQARRAKTVDGHARHGDGATGAQSGLAGDVGTSCTFGCGATHDDVIHLTGFDASAFDGVLDSMATECGAVGHVEGTLPALG